ncbi:MAG: twin-arginine translocase subunit TatC [Thermoanaerobaculales bacterium]|nr:twin-arginine translocase subunit TatC [Thermoanaerobaculales bacterium]
MTDTLRELPADQELEKDTDLDRMSLLQHLDELRRRLMISAIAIFVGFLGCWYFAPVIFRWLEEPILKALPEGEQLAFTELSGPFMLYVKVALLAGIFLASPVVLSQVWLFIRPGLYKKEKNLALPFIFFTSLFFLAGGYFGYLVAFPMVVKFLLSVGEDFKQVVTIGTYFSMMSKILLGLGLVFEIPMIIFFFARLGLVSARQLLRWFKWAVLSIFFIAALITPTPDIATQTVFAVPMILLYLLGVVVAAMFGRKEE